MNEHGVLAQFAWSRSARRFGECVWRKPESSDLWEATIRLSSRFVARNSDDEVYDTILHEIAHVKRGPEHGHDLQWRAIALLIGCSGNIACSEDTVKPEGRRVNIKGLGKGTCRPGHYREPRPPKRGELLNELALAKTQPTVERAVIAETENP